MPADMKQIIAEATRALLTERRLKKLTVKDIVERCNITRQTFYYHFEDIPDLFRWMIREYTNSIFREALSKGNTEDGLRSFFVMAINALPYAKRGMESNYVEEFERISRQNIQYFSRLSQKSRTSTDNAARLRQKSYCGITAWRFLLCFRNGTSRIPSSWIR